MDSQAAAADAGVGGLKALWASWTSSKESTEASGSSSSGTDAAAAKAPSAAHASDTSRPVRTEAYTVCSLATARGSQSSSSERLGGAACEELKRDDWPDLVEATGGNDNGPVADTDVPSMSE